MNLRAKCCRPGLPRTRNAGELGQSSIALEVFGLRPPGCLKCLRQQFDFTHRHAVLEFHQSINNNPLIMSIATAVPPCTPNAMVLLPP